MEESIYERQKRPVVTSVEGVADPNQVCHKCGRTAKQLRECEHCGWNVLLCFDCYFSKEHWEDYRRNYTEDYP